MQSIDKDDDGVINRDEFINYFLNRYRKNNEASRPLFLKRVSKKLKRTSRDLGHNEFDLVDRILFGIQQAGADKLTEERYNCLNNANIDTIISQI